MKKIIAFVICMAIAITILLTACSSEPELVVSNAYKHRGDYYGNYIDNTYTFVIKNNSRTKDIESVDYFTIYFFDKHGNSVGSWNADRTALNKLALDAGHSWEVQIDVAESVLPYSENWSYDTEYLLNYYD